MPIDKINPAAAANAYSNIQKAGSGTGVAAAPKGPSFGDMLKNAVRDSVDTVRAGEKATAAAVVGDANLTDVIEAVTQAELTLQTVVAVRDRMLSAYQEIMRLPI